MILTGAGAGDGGGPEWGRNHRLPGVPPDDEEEKLRGRPDAGHSLLNFTCVTRITEERPEGVFTDELLHRKLSLLL